MTDLAEPGSGGDRMLAMESELEALRVENARLRGLLGLDDRATAAPKAAWKPTLFTPAQSTVPVVVAVDRTSPAPAKIALFRSLFVGRDDVYAQRWDNERNGKAGWGPVVRGGWANARRPDREYLPYTDEVIETHLAGGFHAGLYPLLRGDSCRLLACDFDGPGWAADALAYLDAAHAEGIPPREYVEDLPDGRLGLAGLLGCWVVAQQRAATYSCQGPIAG